LDQGKTALVRPSSNYKPQTHPLVRKHRTQNCNCPKKIKKKKKKGHESKMDA
jgi:hypothetical protein